MLETERNKWLGDFSRALDASGISSSVREQLMGLVEQRRRRGQHRALATGPLEHVAVHCRIKKGP